MTRQKLGQHFLADLDLREQIARAIRVSRHSLTQDTASTDSYCWVEIGAGHGEMTEYLVQGGAPVFAIEVDPPLIAGLKRLAKQYSNLTIVPGDVLKIDLRAFTGGRRVRVYGNLPYYITSPILHHLFDYSDIVDEIHIVIQKEVGQRLAAVPGTRDYGYISIVTQFYSRPEYVLDLPRRAFDPPPEVDSALLTLRLPGAGAKLGLADADAFLKFAQLCFGQKRKTLANNLRGKMTPQEARSLLAELSLREDARAEQLSVADLAKLYLSVSGRLIKGNKRSG